MKKLFVSIALVSMLLLCVVVTLRAAETGIRTERVKFAKGATSAVIKGQVKGSGDVDYLVRAGAGQTITVSLKVSNRIELLQRVCLPAARMLQCMLDKPEKTSRAFFLPMVITRSAFT